MKINPVTKNEKIVFGLLFWPLGMYWLGRKASWPRWAAITGSAVGSVVVLVILGSLLPSSDSTVAKPAAAGTPNATTTEQQTAPASQAATIQNKLKRQEATTRHLTEKVTALKAQLRRTNSSRGARYQARWQAGHKAGYDEGHSAGFDEGHSAGYDEGLAASVDTSGADEYGTDAGAGCDPNYTGCVPDYNVVGDVDCADVDGPVEVLGDDPHGLDGDGDGVACEW